MKVGSWAVQAASVKQFPNLGSCLYNYTCHSFPNLKIGLITTLLSQNTQLYSSFNIDKFHMLKTSMLGNRSADVKAVLCCVF